VIASLAIRYFPFYLWRRGELPTYWWSVMEETKTALSCLLPCSVAAAPTTMEGMLSWTATMEDGVCWRRGSNGSLLSIGFSAANKILYCLV
jgi:hypothetical protein